MDGEGCGVGNGGVPGKTDVGNHEAGAEINKDMTMDYRFETIDNVLVVSIDGRLVASCSEEFKDAMQERLGDAKQILFDLKGMVHIDSSGLGALVSLLQWVHTRGGAMKLANLQPRPKIVFDITKVYRVFEIFDTTEEALASFANPPTDAPAQ